MIAELKTQKNCLEYWVEHSQDDALAELRMYRHWKQIVVERGHCMLCLNTRISYKVPWVEALIKDWEREHGRELMNHKRLMEELLK